MNWSMTLQRRRAGLEPGYRGDDESAEDYRDRMRVTEIPPPPGAKDPTLPRPAGWHPDPTQRHQIRFYDGVEWTEHVADDGVQSEDARGVDAANEVDES